MNRQQVNFSFTARSVRFILVALAMGFIGVYVAVALSRVAYPYELEWMEGGVLEHVARLVSGKDLYVEPSLEFTPFVYTPLYYYVSAGFVEVFGPGFFPLRLVSFLASLGSMVVLFGFVRKETGSAVLGVLSVGLFSAAFKISGAWYDIARVDSLFILLLLASVYVVRFSPSFRGLLLAGALISLSVLTKQIAVVVGVAMSVYSIVFLPRNVRFVYPLAVIIIAGSLTLVLNRVNDGWFWYYVFELPRQHPLSMKRLLGFWIQDMGMLTVAFSVSLVYPVSLLRGRNWKKAGFYALLMTGMVGASWIARMHTGNYSNVLIPAFAVTALVFPLGLRALVPDVFSGARTDGAGSEKRFALSDYLVVFVCIGQFVNLVYNPFAQVPSAEDRIAGDNLVRKIEKIDGDVFIPCHGYLSILSGKKSYAHVMALSDVIRSEDIVQRKRLMEQLAGAFRRQEFSAVILGGEDRLGMKHEVERWYLLQGRVFKDGDVFYPVTGALWRPEYLYVPGIE